MRFKDSYSHNRCSLGDDSSNTRILLGVIILPFSFSLSVVSIWQHFCEELCAYVNFNHVQQRESDDKISACTPDPPGPGARVCVPVHEYSVLCCAFNPDGDVGGVPLSAGLPELCCNNKTTVAAAVM